MSTIANITAADGWYIGEDKSLVFTITDNNSVPIDITGWTIKFSLSATYGGANVANFPKTATLTTPLGGVCTVFVQASHTSGLDPTSSPDATVDYWYTLWRTDVGAKAELAGGHVDLLDPQTTVPS